MFFQFEMQDLPVLLVFDGELARRRVHHGDRRRRRPRGALVLELAAPSGRAAPRPSGSRARTRRRRGCSPVRRRVPDVRRRLAVGLRALERARALRGGVGHLLLHREPRALGVLGRDVLVRLRQLLSVKFFAAAPSTTSGSSSPGGWPTVAIRSCRALHVASVCSASTCEAAAPLHAPCIQRVLRDVLSRGTRRRPQVGLRPRHPALALPLRRHLARQGRRRRRRRHGARPPPRDAGSAAANMSAAILRRERRTRRRSMHCASPSFCAARRPRDSASSRRECAANRNYSARGAHACRRPPPRSESLLADDLIDVKRELTPASSSSSPSSAARTSRRRPSPPALAGELYVQLLAAKHERRLLGRQPVGAHSGLQLGMRRAPTASVTRSSAAQLRAEPRAGARGADGVARGAPCDGASERRHRGGRALARAVGLPLV